MKIEFKNVKEMICWLVDNEGRAIYDTYGRAWKYINLTFMFKDLGGDFKEGIHCLHLYGTELYTVK